MHSLNTSSASYTFAGSMPSVYSVPRSAWYIVMMSTWQVPPETGAMERSIWSAPASRAARYWATHTPAVSWEWNTMWVSEPSSFRARLTVSCTTAGVVVPEASLKHTEW